MVSQYLRHIYFIYFYAVGPTRRSLPDFELSKFWSENFHFFFTKRDNKLYNTEIFESHGISHNFAPTHWGVLASLKDCTFLPLRRKLNCMRWTLKSENTSKTIFSSYLQTGSEKTYPTPPPSQSSFINPPKYSAITLFSGVSCFELYLCTSKARQRGNRFASAKNLWV